MNRMRNVVACALLVLITMVGLYACGGDQPTPTPAPPTETPVPPTDTPAPPTATTASTSGQTGGVAAGGIATGPAIDLMDKASQTMKTVKSMHIKMVVMSGTEQSLVGEGDVEPPDKVRLTMDMGSLGSSEIVLVGQDTYMKLGTTESYTQLPASMNPLAGMGSIGDPGALQSFAQVADSADIVGDEKIDGIDTTHITFSYDLDKAMQAASSMGVAAPTPAQSQGKAKGEAWIEKDTNFIHQIKFVTAAAASATAGAPATGESTVTITYSKFNEPVSPPIEKPANVTTMPGLGTGLGETPTP